MATVVGRQQQLPIRSTIPARLDRFRWTPFHTRMVIELGTAWVLDGPSVTVARAEAIAVFSDNLPDWRAADATCPV